MAAVSSEGALRAIAGETASTGAGSWWAAAGGGIDLGVASPADYGALYAQQPQVRKVVSFLARNIGELGIHLYRRLADDDRERVTGHPFTNLIAFPQGRDPARKTTRSSFIETIVSDRAIYDNAYVLKIRHPSTGDWRLWRLPPEAVAPTGSGWLPPDGYRLYGPRGTRDLKAGDVIHFRGYNPADARVGLSPLATLRQILLEDSASDGYRAQLWARGARMSGYLSRPAEAPPWSDPARERFGMEWQAEWSGDGAKAGGTPILEDGMTWTQGSFSARDSQWLEGKRLTREEVASAFHIPLTMVGILDHATFSNVADQHKQLYQDTLGSWLNSMQEDLELQLLPDLDDDERLYVEFNLAEKLRGSFEEQSRSFQAAVGAPWMLRNEARARLNLPALPDEVGNVIVTPLNVLVGGLASPLDTAPPAVDAAALAAEATRFFDRQARAVSSRAGKPGAERVAAVFDAARWDRELTDLLAAAGVGETEAARVAGEVNRRTAEGLARLLAAGQPIRAGLADPDRAARDLVTEICAGRPPALTERSNR